MWVSKSVCLNFPQVWVDQASGRRFDFAAVADPAALGRLSDEAEGLWLDGIDRARAAFLATSRRPESAAWLQGQAAALNEQHGLGSRGVAVPLGDPELLARWWFEREMCKRDLYYLSKRVLGYDKLKFHLHKFMAEGVQDVGPGYRGLREFPRDAYKSTVMGISFAIQRILRDPTCKVLYKMNAGDNAANKVEEGRRHFLENEALRALFPEHVCSRVSDQGSRLRWRSPANRSPQAEGNLTAAGVGSTKGGTSQHYDIVLGDDFWDEKSVTNPEQSEKVREDMAGIEYVLAQPSAGIILYIGTRFAHDDPTEQLLQNPVFECVIASGITRAGRSLLPENLALEHMVGQSLNSYVFSCQVMLNPTDESRGLDTSLIVYDCWEDFRRLELLGLAASRKVLVCDATVEGKKNSDYVAVQCLAFDHLGRVWVLDYVREKLEPSAFMDVCYRMWDKWLPEFLVRQKSAVETTILSFMRQKNRERGERGKSQLRFYDYALRQRDKKMRITAALQPWLAERRIVIDRDCPHRQELENEIGNHPNSRNDDGIDALSVIDDAVVSRRPSFRPSEKSEPLPPVSESSQATGETAARRAAARRAFEQARARKSARRPAGWRIA